MLYTNPKLVEPVGPDFGKKNKNITIYAQRRTITLDKFGPVESSYQRPLPSNRKKKQNKTNHNNNY